MSLMILLLPFSSETPVNTIVENEAEETFDSYEGEADVAMSFIHNKVDSWYVQYLKENLDYQDVEPKRSTVVYVVDAQIDLSPAVLEKINVQASYDFTGEGFLEECANNHGLLVSSVIGNYKFGVAKGVRIVGLKVFPCDDDGKNLQHIIDALSWVVDNVNLSHNNIVNLSLSTDNSNEDLNNVLNILTSRSVSVVTAAGNAPVDACDYAVGARVRGVTVVSGLMFNRDSNMLESNPEYGFGECVDFWMPSENIWGYTYTDDFTKLDARTASGTSIATALYSGVLAAKDKSWREIISDSYSF